MGYDSGTGQPAAGFPKWSGGFSLFTPAVGDLLGTGTVAVAAMTREGYLHVWDTPGTTAGNTEAWHWHQDDRNTGHYGTDTRPPAGIRDLLATQSAGGDTLNFTSPGDDWNFGTATSYQVRRSNAPITQGNFAAATPVDVSQKPKVAGSAESLAVSHPAGTVYYAVRAVDKAGNIGPVPFASGQSNGGIPASSGPGSLPNTGGGSAGAGVLLGLAILVLATLWLRRRAPV